jgi:galactokinase
LVGRGTAPRPDPDTAALSRDYPALAAELERLEPEAAARPAAIRVVRAPGRVNLIGEHTDYNDGLVLPAAIDLGISIAFVPTDDRQVRLTLVATGEACELDLDAPGSRRGAWSDYVAGTAWALEAAGAATSGFVGILAADLPSEAGLSSSAALELATALALGGGLPPLADRLALAQVARRAENEFVGVPSGLMDQFAVAFGVDDAALMLDCRSLEHRIVPLPPGLALVIADSGVPRRLAASGYAQRRAECDRATEQLRQVEPGIGSLRDVTVEILASAGGVLDPIALRRARHVVTENARVEAAVEALERGDLPALGELFAASHASLREDFEVSTPELDRLVELAAATPGVVGARITGAGFGGATINLVDIAAALSFVEQMLAVYRTPDGRPPRVLTVRATAGAALVWPAPGAAS